MRRIVMTTDGMRPTEDVQDTARVAAIVAAIGGCSPADMPWDDQPAIVVDCDGNILDGHHRYAAAVASGLRCWPALVVDRNEFAARARASSIAHAVRWAADLAGDDVTWGAVQC